MQNNYTGDKYLSFTIGENHFAIGINSILNVIELDDMSSISESNPNKAYYIKQFDRQVLVINSNDKFGIPVPSSKRFKHVVFIESKLNNNKNIIGIAVDDIGQYISINPKDILNFSSVNIKHKLGIISGLSQYDEHSVLILDFHPSSTTNTLNINYQSLNDPKLLN